MDEDAEEVQDFPRPSCSGCVHVYLPERSAQWYRWLCMKAPADPVWNPVTGKQQADPPYRTCRDTNRGSCEMFQGGLNSLNSPHRTKEED